MVVTDAASPTSDEAERVALTGILSEFRGNREEEIDTVRRTTTPAANDGARKPR